MDRTSHLHLAEMSPLSPLSKNIFAKNTSRNTTSTTTLRVHWERPVFSTLPSEENTLDVMSVSWPLRTGVLCHHCCHGFDSVPVPLPESYDPVKKIYFCRGNFCSWQCAKAFNNQQTPTAGRGNRNMYISLLAHRTWIKFRKDTRLSAPMKTYALYSIYPSRPKEELKVFGGTLSIQEYREGFFGIIPPEEATQDKPFLTVRQRLVLPFVDDCETTASTRKPSISGKPSTQKIGTSAIHKYSNEFCNRLNRAKTDNDIVKRKKMDSGKSTLMSTMGVVIKRKKR